MPFLTEAQRAGYHADGLAFPLAVLSPAEVLRYRAACDELEEQLGGQPRTIEVRQMHLHFCWAWELATHPRILDAVEDLLGADLLIWATELFAKRSGGNVSIGWHRDRPYLGLAAGRSITAWVALSESTVANGCMRVLPRSAERVLPPLGGAGNPLAGVEDRLLADVVLRPGEMSLHDADVLHGSGANRSGEKRIGFVIRFLTADARPLHGRHPVVVARGRPGWLEGEDSSRGFTLADPPGLAGTTEPLAGMRESAARHLESMLTNLRDASR
jgi:hypothetical protein